jgi:hypothetical protein
MKRYILLLLSIPVLCFSQVQLNTPAVNVEFIDSTYNFNEIGFSYSTINILTRIGWNIGGPYHSASLGAVNLADGSILFNRTWKEDTVNMGGSYNLAFNPYNDNTWSVRVSDADFDGYFLLDDSLNITLNLHDVDVFPDNHGIAKLQDGRYAYFEDTIQDMVFASDVISDSTVWPSLGHNVVIFDPTDSSKTKIFDWFSSIDSSFVIPGYLYEGDLDGTTIDWGHPNSLFEDYDGHLLLSWRHLGVCKMDVNTGDVIWWFGLPDSLGVEHGFNEPVCGGGDCFTRLQHDLYPIVGHPNQYSLFDNGDSSRNYSRALFIAYDTASNTMNILKEPQYPQSNFMGSVDVLEDGSYIVNVPSIQRLPFDRIPAWVQNGQFADSIPYYIHLLGSEIYFHDSNDQLRAKFVTDSANFVYNSKFLDFSDWPAIFCSNDTLQQTVSSLDMLWLDANKDSISSASYYLADGQTYYLGFPFGITQGYSPKFNSASCLVTGIVNSSIVDFKAYPNPVGDMLHFSISLDLFNVVDVSGRSILSGQGSYLETASFLPGIYFVYGEIDGFSVSFRFLKD